MKEIPNKLAQEVVRAIDAVLSDYRPKGLREVNALRHLRRLKTRLKDER